VDAGCFLGEVGLMAVPAVFLDRDGVIIENRSNYVRSWADVEFIQPALAALISLSQHSLPIVIVTNQSAVGRHIITPSMADEINQRVVLAIEQAGGRVDAVFICPHAPDDHCACRKPEPGLLLGAAKKMNLDLSRSFLVGDALTDIQAGRSAGLRRTAMVLTGRGREQLALPGAAALEPLEVFADLKAVVENGFFI
jgi:D-glycero-D-manno-heptose 1,7-bisphosphate phosphatase